MKNQVRRIENIPGVPSYLIEQMRPKRYQIALVIPVINEGVRIIKQLEKFQNYLPNVDLIIADGGSTDASIEYFHSDNSLLTALLTKQSTGNLSSQLRMAFHYCLESDYEAVITMDGNDKDGIEGIEGIKEALEAGIDFVQGSRFLKGGIAINTPIKRLLAIRLIHAPLTSAGARFWFTDTTNGFRGHSRNLLNDKRLGIFRDEFKDYELLCYMPISAGRHKLRLCEVPVKRVYPLTKKIPTKINGIFSEVRLLWILVLAICGKYNP